MSELARIDSQLAARLRLIPWDNQRSLGEALAELGPGLQGPIDEALSGLRREAARSTKMSG